MQSGTSHSDDFGQVLLTVSDATVLSLLAGAAEAPAISAVGIGEAFVRAESRLDPAVHAEVSIAAAQIVGLVVSPNPGAGHTFESVRFTATAALETSGGADTTDATSLVQWTSDAIGCAAFTNTPGLATVTGPLPCIAPMHADFSASVSADFELHGAGN